jgi:glycosyltransferase involved in cell wall biosynthesis
VKVTDQSKSIIYFREGDAKKVGKGCYDADFIYWLNGDNIEMGDNVGFNFGWAGFDAKINSRHTDTVLPNKVFEYIACGLPVVIFPHKSLKAFLEIHNLGIIIEDVNELMPALLDNGIEILRQNLIKNRNRFTIEAHIHQVRQIYEQVMAS